MPLPSDMSGNTNTTEYICQTSLSADESYQEDKSGQCNIRREFQSHSPHGYDI